MLQYLKGTRGLKLILTAEDMSVVKWWIDASYAQHWDSKGHTGGMMSLGKGAVTSKSNKQKIQGRSSTEDEIIGVFDMLPQVIWSLYFIEAQGYKVARNVIKQDNKSAILLEKNGRASSSSATKHIHNRFFYVKDQIDQGLIEVEHCPAEAPFPEERMWADVLTKPKQGTAYREDRAILMNCPVNYVDKDIHEDIEHLEGVLKPEQVRWTKPSKLSKRIPVKARLHKPSLQECVGKLRNQ